MQTSNKRKSGLLHGSISSKTDSSDTIRVVCRFRPPKKSESHEHNIFHIDEDHATVEIKLESLEEKVFKFDRASIFKFII